MTICIVCAVDHGRRRPATTGANPRGYDRARYLPSNITGGMPVCDEHSKDLT